MASYRSVGLDLGIKTTHEVVAMEPGREQPCARFRCGHTRADLEEMLERVQVGMEPGTELRFIMEPTGTAWMPVAAFLQEKGFAVYLVKGELVKDQRKVLKKHAKTDQLDATTLASLFWVVPKALHRLRSLDPQMENLRRRVKRAHKLSTAVSNRKKRIEACVHLGLPAGLEELELCSAAGRVLCLGYLNPWEVQAMGLNSLTVAVQRAAGVKAGQEAADIWYQASVEAIKLYGHKCPVDYEELQDELQMEFAGLDLEQQQLEKIQARIDELSAEIHPSRNLQTIPGVGPYVAAASLAAIADPQRFRTAKKFRAYTGMVPRVSASGQTESKGMRISKAGPNWEKRALFLGADTARQWDPQLAKLYYDQMVRYGKRHTQAVCAVAAHLADRIFVVLRDDRPYELRDLAGNPVTPREAKAYIQAHLTVPEEVRKRLRKQNKGKHQPSRVRAN